jgi:Ca2+-binding RTX toxin-like protein
VRAATIDLRAAHLGYGEGSGGYISFAAGIFGGFTIANGVVIENATGAGGADRITGNEAGNRLSGRGGDDSIAGGDGDDLLVGGDGNDSLEGGAGADSLRGGAGRDILDGQADADRYIFLDIGDSGASPGARDRIHGFEAGLDVIDLQALGTLLWLDQDRFGGIAGQVRWRANDTGVVLQLDADGVGGADFELFLRGATGLVLADLAL